MRTKVPRRSAALVVALCLSVPAAAQERRWELGVRVGGQGVHLPESGAFDLPQPGRQITGAEGDPTLVQPTREVASWFFGDGAVILNEVLTQYGLGSATLVPIDGVLTEPLATGRSGAVVTASLTRTFATGPEFELSVGVSHAGVGVSGDVLDALEVSRAGFLEAWNALLPAVADPVAVSVTASLEAPDESNRQLQLAGTVHVPVWRYRAGVLYATGGGALVTYLGDAPSIGLTGRYRFDLGGRSDFDEEDEVRVRLEASPRELMGVFGAGWKQDLSDRWGFRADLRVHARDTRLRTTLEATPFTQVIRDDDRNAVLETATNPTIRLFNGVDARLRSTLSADALFDFQTFESRGWRYQVLLDVGVFLRF